VRSAAARRSAGAFGTATVMVKEGARRRADVPFWRERGCGQRAWVLWGVRRRSKAKRVR
jgi:hypothetical protein